ncbi:MAG TPA: hypothetical protein VFY15_00265 [Acidimicrobiia bacterium]|nr:hypothetical protein [Acidimicrobiia bacterium]
METVDTRHGRWILPLLVLAMVVLTYTFVNSLEPSNDPTGTTGAEPPFPTDGTSSTTSLPPEIASFMVTIDIFENQATAFRDEVLQINDDWDNRRIIFAEARTSFLEVQSELEDWESAVTEVSGVPAALAEGHVNLVIEVSDLSAKVGDIVLGLEAPDDGTARRTAVAAFEVHMGEVLAAIEAIRTTATSPTTTTTVAS